MQPITSFNNNLGTAILLLGPPGGGKTVLGCRLFPKTYVLVADLNFSSGLRYLEKLGETSNIVGFDTVTVDEKGAKVPVSLWYDRFFKCISAAASDPNVETIFIDSATFVADYITAKLAAATNEAAIRFAGGKDSFDKWGQYLVVWRGLIMQLRQSGKRLIMSAHEKKEKDESDGIYKYQIMLDGQIKEKLPNMFSDVWRCEVEEAAGKYRWMVRTLGNVRHELKNTFGFDGLIESDALVKQIRSTLK